MKALVYQGKNKIGYREVPKPKIGEHDLLMKVRSVGICGTDLHLYRGGLGTKPGVIPGHEFSGTVAAVGKRVTGFKLGDRIVGEHVVSCGRCSYCQIGKPNLCAKREIIGVHRPGALAEYLSLPASLVHRIPESLSFEEAALVEPLSIAVYAVREAGLLLSKRAAVIGQGPVGLLMDQVLSASGALVTGIEVRQHALDFAKSKGWIHHAINSQAENINKRIGEVGSPDGFDLTFEVVGIEQTAELSFEITRSDGSVYLLGVFSTPARIDLMNIVRKELNVFGSWTCAFSFPDAIDLIERKKVDVKSLITHRYRAVDGAQAFSDAASYAEDRIKSIINF